MKEIIPYILAIAAGVFTSLEADINSQLGRATNPKVATLHNLVVGFMVVLLINLMSGNFSEYGKIINVRPRWLIGGVFGALITYFIAKAVPKLGITVTLIMVVAAQVLSSLYIDVIIEHQPLGMNKLFGVLLVLAGVYFITEY